MERFVLNLSGGGGGGADLEGVKLNDPDLDLDTGTLVPLNRPQTNEQCWGNNFKTTS